MIKKHTLSVLVRNHMGVLTRVSGLISRRGYNIESMSVGVTEDKEISRMTLILECDEDIFNQVKNQLGKLYDVIAIQECLPEKSVQRELALIKIDAEGIKRSKILEIANIFRARVIDVNAHSMILEATGDDSKITAMISMLEEFGIKEVIRTGVTAIARGEEEFKKINFN